MVLALPGQDGQEGGDEVMRQVYRMYLNKAVHTFQILYYASTLPFQAGVLIESRSLRMEFKV